VIEARCPGNYFVTPITPHPQRREQNGEREEKARRDAAEPSEHSAILARANE
jgi:hypothetical protein